MKKVCLIAAMLPLSLHTALASPPPSVGEIRANIGVVNNTNDSMSVTCKVGTTTSGNYSLSSPVTIPPGQSHKFSGTAGNGCGIGNMNYSDTYKIQCDYQTAGKSGYFQIYACSEEHHDGHNGYQLSYSNSTPTANASGGTPPDAYACPYPGPTGNAYGSQTESFACPNGTSMTRSWCNVEAYYAVGVEGPVGPTYTLTWDNIKANLATGQAMAAKLTSILQNTGDYGRPKATYKDNKMTIILPPPTAPNPNPYASSTSLSQCQGAYSAYPTS